MALFLSPHLLLRWKRPSLRPAGTEDGGYNQAIAMQAATRTATQGGGTLIRKMRPFEEPHTVAFHKDIVKLARQGTLVQFERISYA
jgi:hypothetical protein